MIFDRNSLALNSSVAAPKRDFIGADSAAAGLLQPDQRWPVDPSIISLTHPLSRDLPFQIRDGLRIRDRTAVLVIEFRLEFGMLFWRAAMCSVTDILRLPLIDVPSTPRACTIIRLSQLGSQHPKTLHNPTAFFFACHPAVTTFLFQFGKTMPQGCRLPRGAQPTHEQAGSPVG